VAHLGVTGTRTAIWPWRLVGIGLCTSKKLWSLSLSLRPRIRGATARFRSNAFTRLPLLSCIEYSAADSRPFGREQDTAGYVGRDQHG